jgi:hypothetical protein
VIYSMREREQENEKGAGGMRSALCMKLHHWWLGEGALSSVMYPPPHGGASADIYMLTIGEHVIVNPLTS